MEKTKKKTVRKKTTKKRTTSNRKTPVKEALGISSQEKAFLDAYYVGVVYNGENTKDNKEMSISAAGYAYTGDSADLQKRYKADSILRKKESKAYVNHLLKDVENELVYHKIWVMQQTKHLFETTMSDQVKANLLKQMREDLGMNKEQASNDINDRIKDMHKRFNEARKKEGDNKMLPLPQNAVPFGKEGTNG